MNKRQKKKAFKKRFGVNPPKGMKLRTATILLENKEAFIIAIKKVKEALLNAWEQIKELFLIFAEELLKAAKEIDRRLKEREVVAIEGGFNIHSNERR